ncbi:hypothetical protein RclHR1_02650003 [Rhizophagus clarus]|uniref:Crinkler effector protein N-terminal domain-containing protein n=1 Tax=Rhizophagus clarus TaxID=94130 RepID=A0A2Z6R524_9GLOM|nr:hypothetical protein RclHR1_02650003 [Rhizophagus clarus]
MTSLRCFVVTTSHTNTISIKVDGKDTIDDLRKKIKANEDYELDEQDEFTVWKINLPKKEYRKKAGLVRSYIPFNLSVKEVLDGEELRVSKMKIEEIFPHADKNYYHVAIQILPLPNNSAHIFVDDSNLFIEGKFAIGTREKLGCNSSRGLQLQEFRIDHGMLLEVVLDGRPKGSKPVLVGSRPPSDENLWNFIRKYDYEVNVLDRNVQGCEKGVDPTLGYAIDSTVSSHPPGILILVAGDGDYYPHIMPALHYNWKVEVWFWKQAISKRLKDAFSENNKVKFQSLEDRYKLFSYGDGVPSFKSNLAFLILHGEAIYEWKNRDIFECFRSLDLFGWLKWVDNYTVHLYFKKGKLERAKKWINENWVNKGPKIDIWENT